MPLPQGGIDSTWPPKPWADVFAGYAEWAAWYSGNPQQLAELYGGYITTYERAPWYRFWNRTGRQRIEHQARTQLHMPLAGDIASTSAALLFSEAPTIAIPQAHDDVEMPDAEAVAAEGRLHQIIEAADVEAVLLEAAETSAAIGGVYLKVDWDTEFADHPFLTVVQADMALPEFRYGRMVAVTLWHVVEVDKQTVWRHVERHEPGVVLHGLYRGRKDRLGEQVGLEAHPATAGLPEQVTLPFDDLAIRYIPNMRPNRRFRGSPLGQSDLAGSEGMLDALDETWTSWMRDIRLAKARILIPEEYLQRSSGSNGYLFDMDQEVFTPLDMAPGQGQIEISQFAIRVEEHERTVMALTEQIISHAGYSPQSFGLQGNGSEITATETRARERKSFMTQQKKRRYWETPLADLFQIMLEVDRAEFKRATTVYRPTVALADSLTETMNELAATVNLIAQAGAASVEVKVRTLHPDWTEELVLAEVERIREEQGLLMPDPMQLGVA